jgi:excisionase family DNA binding protein
MEQLLTTAQVAEILQVTKLSVRNFVKWGHLPAIRIGKKGRPLIRIRKSDLEEYIQNGNGKN